MYTILRIIPANLSTHVLQAKAFLHSSTSLAPHVLRHTPTTVRGTRTASTAIGTAELLLGAGIPLRGPTAGVPLDETSDVAVRSTVFIESTAFTPLLCDRVDIRFLCGIAGECGVVQILTSQWTAGTMSFKMYNFGIWDNSTKGTISRGGWGIRTSLYTRNVCLLYMITAS